MSKTKLTGPCTEDQFWTEVAHIGWGTKTTDYNAIKKELLSRWTPEFANSFDAILGKKVRDLQNEIEQWEKLDGRKAECGDDSFSDLTHHIAGLGKDVYEATMTDPELAFNRAREDDYTESFSYAIPRGGRGSAEPLDYELESDPEDLPDIVDRRRLGDWYDLSPEKYKRWAQRRLDRFRAALAHPLGNFIHSDISLCIPPLKALAEDGDIEAFLAAKNDLLSANERIEQWRQEACKSMSELNYMLSYWGMKNLCSDVEQWMTP